eukprot:9298724-Prorocentrum_lima.AAC.1
MTSSLVGSEMCIRDRVRTSIRKSDLGHVCSQRLLRTPPRRLRLWNGAAAVSYTHLTLPTICSV